MQTRVIHHTDESTVSALANRKNGQTLRVLARELGHPYFSIATLSDVLRRRPGAVSLHTENDLRLRLGLPAIGLTFVPACPVHGVPHIADCHGADVAAVVTLAPGETVKRPGKARTRKHYHRPCMDDETYKLWLAFKDARGAESERTIAVWLERDDPEDYEPEEAIHEVA